jgi:16S rRNA processing protein RimM
VNRTVVESRTAVVNRKAVVSRKAVVNSTVAESRTAVVNRVVVSRAAVVNSKAVDSRTAVENRKAVKESRGRWTTVEERPFRAASRFQKDRALAPEVALTDLADSSGEYITLALVVKTQGRHGEVGAELHTDVPDRFVEGMKLVALAKGADSRRELQVEEIWPHKGLLILKFAGVDSMNDAETLIGSELQVPGRERAKLEPGWTYVSDLIGCMVLDHGREIGRIEDVQSGTGEAPLLMVASAAGKRFDVPFAEAYLQSVDVAGKRVLMNLPEGMLEVNAPMTAEEKQQQRSDSKKH